jgi:hypothetical protein
VGARVGVLVGWGTGVCVGAKGVDVAVGGTGVCVGAKGVDVAVGEAVGSGTGVVALISLCPSAPLAAVANGCVWIGEIASLSGGVWLGSVSGAAVFGGGGVTRAGTLAAGVRSTIQIETIREPMAPIAQARSSRLAAVTGHHRAGARRVPPQARHNISPAARSFLHHLHFWGGSNPSIISLALCTHGRTFFCTISFYHRPGAGASLCRTCMHRQVVVQCSQLMFLATK